MMTPEEVDTVIWNAFSDREKVELKLCKDDTKHANHVFAIVGIATVLVVLFDLFYLGGLTPLAMLFLAGTVLTGLKRSEAKRELSKQEKRMDEIDSLWNQAILYESDPEDYR